MTVRVNKALEDLGTDKYDEQPAITEDTEKDEGVEDVGNEDQPEGFEIVEKEVNRYYSSKNNTVAETDHILF